MPPDLMSKVDKSGGCWLWTASLQRDGYGKATVRENGLWRTRDAHRVVYEFLVGQIPAGLELDHLCNNRRCVRPAHLEPVTGAENRRRAHARQRALLAIYPQTHCANGHEWTPDTAYIWRDGTRRCRPCGRLAARRYRAQKGDTHAAA